MLFPRSESKQSEQQGLRGSLLLSSPTATRHPARGRSSFTCPVACPSDPPQGAGLLLQGRCVARSMRLTENGLGKALLHLLCEQPPLTSEGKTCWMDRGGIWSGGWLCLTVDLWRNGPLVQGPSDTYVLLHRKESMGPLQISSVASWHDGTLPTGPLSCSGCMLTDTGHETVLNQYFVPMAGCKSGNSLVCWVRGPML